MTTIRKPGARIDRAPQARGFYDTHRVSIRPTDRVMVTSLLRQHPDEIPFALGFLAGSISLEDLTSLGSKIESTAQEAEHLSVLRRDVGTVGSGA